jgi:hypothetical protein
MEGQALVYALEVRLRCSREVGEAPALAIADLAATDQQSVRFARP